MQVTLKRELRLAARTGPGRRAELLDIARLARPLAGSGTSLS
jgi:hypothetical protein